MTLTRRSTLSLAGGVAAMGLVGYLGWHGFGPGPALAAQPTPATPAGDLRKAERSLGDPAAKVTVQEFFSLTCTHCAAFAQETMPQIERT
jgi:protein-disulfide isomerase